MGVVVMGFVGFDCFLCGGFVAGCGCDGFCGGFFFFGGGGGGWQ